jgi:hypothetical protein
MLKFISLSFNRVGKYFKNIILNRYFNYYALYMKVYPKKTKFLCNKHLKYCNNKFRLKYLVKSKIN